MNDKNVRTILAKALQKVLLENTFSGDVLNETVYAGTDLSDADKGFLVDGIKGIVERKTTLDAVLRRFSRIKPEKLDRPVYLSLLMGLYELLFTDHKEYAVVSAAVDYVKANRMVRQSGYVNGILRNVLRRKETVLPSLEIWEKLSLPLSLYDLLISWYGPETVERMGNYFLSKESKRLTFRRMVSKCSEEELLSSFDTEITPVIRENTADCYGIRGRVHLNQLPAFRKKWIYVQDVSSVTYLNDLRPYVEALPSFSMLDSCASPGGKSLFFMDHCPKGEYTLADIRKNRCERIRENLIAYGFDRCRVIEQDATVYQEAWKKNYDIVLLDVPCSGLGVLSGKPEIKYRTTPESLTEICLLQRKILSNNAFYVKDNGLLAYSTCTTNPMENHGQVEWFLENHPEFNLLKEKQILPGESPMDGFYYALLRKSD